MPTADLPERAPEPQLPPYPDLPGHLRSRKRLSLATVQMSPGAECETTGCPWQCERSPSAMTQAIDHAQETGHVVFVDEITRTAIEVL